MATSSHESNEERTNRRIDLKTYNAWLQDESSKTPADLDRQSTEIAEHYIENHLRGAPDGQFSSAITRDIQAWYGVDPEKEPALVRYTLRKMAASPKTNSTITDLVTNDSSKPDDYHIAYRRD